MSEDEENIEICLNVTGQVTEEGGYAIIYIVPVYAGHRGMIDL